MFSFTSRDDLFGEHMTCDIFVGRVSMLLANDVMLCDECEFVFAPESHVLFR